ncbi:MarR family winged helix-turn-helix transcriptional regulator [Sphingomonas canadensis]|uniref:MarR family winged helix-turn-helix transcriptional regulator n=1 Tax=Sphingomonas canadensis TaxID=1219257 RepID=A0ABW3H6V4_9SPHN|nr:MarR family transcriptional regulator [Sphingomonas canadensis]MCW3835655.1 MarR family transcriptional regulator [Sphingomonas canadensis]
MNGEEEGAGTGGLRDPLAGNLGYQMRRASALVMARFGEALAELDLRVAEASILMVLDANPGATQSGVGRLLGIQRANMAPLITALERRGLIARADTDGRAQPLKLTGTGKALAAQVRAKSDGEEAWLAESLDAQTIAAMTAALRRLRVAG